MKTFIVAALVGLSLMLPALPARAQDAAAIAKGAVLYGQTCTRCHNLTPPAGRTDLQWEVIGLHMRTKANITKSEMAAIVQYLQATNRDIPAQVSHAATSASEVEVPRRQPAPSVVGMPAGRTMPQSASGHVVTIKMVDNGSTIFKFEPKDVRVQRGDTLRFEQTGVAPHNVELKHTPRGAKLRIAAMGPFLLAKGATYDIVIDESFVDGKYEFECTPHQMFGMKGTFTVTGG